MGINVLVHMKHSSCCPRVSVIFISFIIVKVSSLKSSLQVI